MENRVNIALKKQKKTVTLYLSLNRIVLAKVHRTIIDLLEF